MKQNSIETIAGAIVIAVAILFVCFSVQFGGETSDKQKIYKARFDRIDGIVLGADVKISGVKIGSIKKMMVDPKSFMAELTLAIDSKMNLPKDTSAEIISESLLGGKYVALVPGGDDDLLKEGETITYTQSAVNIESLIGQMIFSNKPESEDGTKSGENKK